MTPLTELRRNRGTLQLASKLLMAALLLQLPMIIVIVARLMEFDWKLPGSVAGILWFSTALLAIVGFSMVARQLNFVEEALESSDIPELVNRTRLLGSGKIALYAQMFFYLSFLVPLMNLPAILWGRSRAKDAISSYDALLEKRPRKATPPASAGAR